MLSTSWRLGRVLRSTPLAAASTSPSPSSSSSIRLSLLSTFQQFSSSFTSATSSRSNSTGILASPQSPLDRNLALFTRSLSSSSSTSSSSSSTSSTSSSHPIASRLEDASLFHNQCFVNGNFTSGSTQSSILVHNPSTGAVLDSVPKLSASDVESAVQSASEALPIWSRQYTHKQRSDILRKWYELCTAKATDLGKILTLEQGKPLAEAIGEIQYSASFLQVYSEEATRVYGELIPSPLPSSRILAFPQPVGVVAAITPWNFPSAMITRKCGAALAAGCPVVLKPSELTPFSAFALAELARRAGVPKGVLNIVTGDAAEIGSVLTQSPLVRKLTFTGSTRVGKLLMQQCAGTMKRVSMELGGNAPFLVFEDADVDAAIAGLLVAKFRNTGQTCVSANRIYVQASIYDRFIQALSSAIRTKLKLGDGLSSPSLNVNCGPLINQSAIDKVERHIADAVSKGGKIIVGGKRVKSGASGGHPSVPDKNAGYYFEPTLISDANGKMEASQEETFGPVAMVYKFDTEEEAIAAANNTRVGLAAYFYTKDVGRQWRVMERLEYGMVGVNQGSVSNAVAPFGGVKESGFGREGSHHGLKDYLELKTAHFNLA